MNTISTGPIQPFIVAAPYSPLGKPAVGQESPDTKDKPLPPVEESESPTRSAQHRIGEEAEGSNGGERRQHDAEGEGSGQAEFHEAAPAAPVLHELEVNALGAQLAMRARIDQARHSSDAPSPPAEAPRLPPGGFDTSPPAPAGTLLDQTI